MDTNKQEEPINWYEEVDQEEPEIDDSSGVGLLYDCVFCKRGFNTAQALGGHMNIHRRNRVRRNKRTSTNSKRQEENQRGLITFQQQIPASSCDHVADHHFVHHDHNLPSSSFSTYFPSSVLSTMPINRSHFPNQQDCSNSFDQQQRCSPLEDLEKRRPEIMSQKEELDLDLRLGYDS